MSKYIVQLPFMGFYESIHDDALSRAIDMELDQYGHLLPEGFCPYEGMNTHKAQQEYAKAYAEHVLGELGIEGSFESMASPREYNFTTDRVFVELPEAVALTITAKAAANPERLGQLVADMFTPCSGFIPFYSNSLEKWQADLEGDIAELDHNQLYVALLAAFPEVDFDELEHDFAEEYNCNNQGYYEHLTDAAYETMEAARAKYDKYGF